MRTEIKTIGSGKPKVAVIGCIHGDEIIGQRVISKLKKLKLKQGTLTLITANCKALKHNKRFIETDLNRSFPGKRNGRLEESIAFELKKILQPQDAVLDIHATNSDFNDLALLHHLNKNTKQILKSLPVSKVAWVSRQVFDGRSLLHCCRNAVCLEFGPDKSGRNYQRALACVKQLLVNLNMLPGKQKVFSDKEFYRVTGEYKVDKAFRPSRRLKEFQKIKKGQYIGSAAGVKLYAKQTFYPIFLSPGRYPEMLALMAKKIIINL